MCGNARHKPHAPAGDPAAPYIAPPLLIGPGAPMTHGGTGKNLRSPLRFEWALRYS